MSTTTDYLLLGTGVAALLVGVWVALAPGTAPVGAVSESLAEEGTVTVVGLVLALVVVAVAAVRVRRTGTRTLDRSTILAPPPEQARDAHLQTTAELDRVYQRVARGFESAGQPERYAAVYGRRAIHSEEVTDRIAHGGSRTVPTRNRREPRSAGGPSRHAPQSQAGTAADEWGSIGVVLDDLAELAQEAYATATGCGPEEASRAVDTGAWTDDRVAGAFLAADAVQAPTFTTGERLVAWLLPQRTFERRLDRALTAIDAHAGAFLTYHPGRGSVTESVGRDSDTGGLRRRSVTKSRPDGDDDPGGRGTDRRHAPAGGEE
jgi:hypothetical protein